MHFSLEPPKLVASQRALAIKRCWEVISWYLSALVDTLAKNSLNSSI